MTDSEGATPQPDEEKERPVSYWLKWIKASKKAAETHWDDTRAAWAEYEKSAKKEGEKVTQSYPIYAFRCELLEAAYYSRTPDLTSEISFSINDDVSRTGSLIVERLGAYFERTSHFDDVMYECTGDFIHAAKTAPQVVYESEIEENQIPLYDDGMGGMCTEDGTPYTGETMEMEDGTICGMEKSPKEETQKIYLKSVPYDEVLHTPTAKTPCEITEKAYYFSFTRHEAKEAGFPEEVLREYPWKKHKVKKEVGIEDIESPDEFLDGWECWDKKSKKVYWVSESYPQGYLKEPKDDPYGLRGFFPSPEFAIQRKPRKSLYPTPPYVHLAPTLKQLHTMYERVFKLIDSVRRRALVDGEAEVVEALNSGDLEFISAKNIKSIVEKGGLENCIYYVPVQELVQAISELNALEDRFKANFDEWLGTPDILQGQSDPIESLGAQEIKATSANDRFKNNKKKIQKLARDSLEIMIDLALRVYSDEKIARLVGFEYMEPEDQGRFAEALSMLRDDESRIIRIDIETDSMTFVDKGLKQQRLNTAIQTAINGLKEVSGMQDPEMASVALQTILMSLQEMDVGRKFQDHVKKAGEKLLEKLNTPPPPPPEDPRIALEQQKLEIAQNKQQVDAQLKSQELAIKEQDLSLKEYQATLDSKMEQYKVETDAVLNERIQAFIEWSEAEKLEIERLKVGLDEKEKFLEEVRLKSEQEMETMRTALNALVESKKAEAPQQIKL